MLTPVLQLYNIGPTPNSLDTFPRNFPVDGEVANLLQNC